MARGAVLLLHLLAILMTTRGSSPFLSLCMQAYKVPTIFLSFFIISNCDYRDMAIPLLPHCLLAILMMTMSPFSSICMWPYKVPAIIINIIIISNCDYRDMVGRGCSPPCCLLAISTMTRRGCSLLIRLFVQGMPIFFLSDCHYRNRARVTVPLLVICCFDDDKKGDSSHPFACGVRCISCLDSNTSKYTELPKYYIPPCNDDDDLVLLQLSSLLADFESNVSTKPTTTLQIRTVTSA